LRIGARRRKTAIFDKPNEFSHLAAKLSLRRVGTQHANGLWVQPPLILVRLNKPP
jgi:hypothetical protein